MPGHRRHLRAPIPSTARRRASHPVVSISRSSGPAGARPSDRAPGFREAEGLVHRHVLGDDAPPRHGGPLVAGPGETLAAPARARERRREYRILARDPRRSRAGPRHPGLHARVGLSRKRRVPDAGSPRVPFWTSSSASSSKASHRREPPRGGFPGADAVSRPTRGRATGRTKGHVRRGLWLRIARARPGSTSESPRDGGRRRHGRRTIR